MPASIKLRDHKRTRSECLRTFVPHNRVRWKRKFGGQVGSGRRSLDHQGISNRNNLPIRVRSAKGCGSRVGVKAGTITKTDTVAQNNAPTLIPALSLP